MPSPLRLNEVDHSGRFRASMSGGARLDPEVGRFFLAMGMTLMQGYGKDGSDAGLKAAAGKAVAKVQMHSDMAKKLQAKVSGAKN